MNKDITDPNNETANTHLIALATAKSIGLFVFLRVTFLFLGISSTSRFGDPDTYMRMNRVVHLWRSGRWFDHVYPRIGPDGGLTQHWTRPMDVLLLVGGAVGSPFVGFETALHWWGIIVTPLMMVVVLAILMWTAKPLCPPQWLWLVGFIYIAQPATLLVFDFGRPDHNTIIVPLFIAYLGAMIRLILEPERSRIPIIAGVIAGIALWVSLETAIVMALASLVMALAWVSGNNRIPDAMSRQALTLLATVTIWLPIEFGISQAYRSVFYDQVSAVHLVVLSINALVWLSIAAVNSRAESWTNSMTKRLAVALVVGLPALGTVLLITPDVRHLPVRFVDQLYLETRLVNIAESQPIAEITEFTASGIAGAAQGILLWLGISLPGIAILLHRGLLGRHKATTGQQRWAWLLLGAAVVVYIPISISQIRWTPFAAAALAVPSGVLAAEVAQWITKHAPGRLLPIARPAMLLLAIIWPYLAALALPVDLDSGAETRTSDNQLDSNTDGIDCPVTELAGALVNSDEMGDQPLMVMIFVDFGPELLYSSPYSVLSIPNHRLQPGYTATYNAMSGTAEEAEEILRTNSVDAVVICRESAAEQGFYADENGTDSMYTRLTMDEPPEYLEPVGLSSDLSQPFAVWTVNL